MEGSPSLVNGTRPLSSSVAGSMRLNGAGRWKVTLRGHLTVARRVAILAASSWLSAASSRVSLKWALRARAPSQLK